jgi:hypothetical protein
MPRHARFAQPWASRVLSLQRSSQPPASATTGPAGCTCRPRNAGRRAPPRQARNRPAPSPPLHHGHREESGAATFRCSPAAPKMGLFTLAHSPAPRSPPPEGRSAQPETRCPTRNRVPGSEIGTCTRCAGTRGTASRGRGRPPFRLLPGTRVAGWGWGMLLSLVVAREARWACLESHAGAPLGDGHT